MTPQAALEDVVIVDVTQFESGTVCTQMLAWLGATVIKLERPGMGEQGRVSSVDRPGEDSYGFLLVNANKKSVTLNLKDPDGLALARRLIAQAVVFVANFSRGVIERLGLDYATLRESNPGLIYAQIKGFGSDGPYADFPAFDPIGQAMGGAVSVTGEADGPPLHAGLSVADSGAGYHCALAILAALYQRERSGEGQRIEIAMQDVVINFTRSVWARQLITGEAAPRAGNGMTLAPVAPCNVYPCLPGGPNDYVYIYTSRWPGSPQWANLLRVLGRSDLLDDPRFSTPERRYVHREEVDALIAGWTCQRTKEEAMEALGRADVPAGAVLSTADLAVDPYLRRRGMVVEVEHPVRGKVVIPGNPIKLSASHVPRKPAPRLGQDNEEVYLGMLGLSEDMLVRLQQRGVI